MLPDVAHATVPEGEHPDPAKEAEAGGGGDEDHPEPEEDVDLLVEQVDGQHALDSVWVNGAHLTDLEVAQGDSREPLGGGPLGARNQVPDHGEAVHVIIGAEETVQHKQLTYNVGKIQYLREHVQSHQIVAVSVTAYQT